MGDIEKDLIQQARNSHEPIPDNILNKPVLAASNQFEFNAFFDLDTERAHGQTLTKIPRSAIVAYARECGLTEVEGFELIYLIRKVDAAHLDELARKLRRNGDVE